MKVFLCLFLFLFLNASILSSARGEVCVSERDALSIAMNSYACDSMKCNYWIGEVKSAATIHSNEVAMPFTWLTDTLVDKWLVFVDESPWLNWSHPCSYFYFPKKVGEDMDSIPWFRVASNNPPKIRIIPYSKTLKSFLENRQIAVPPMREPSPTDTDFCNQRNNDFFALIIATGDSPSTNYSRFMKDADYLYGVLDQKYGICPYNTFLLSGSKHFNGLAVDSYTNEYVSQFGLFEHAKYGIVYGPAEGLGYATYENVKRTLRMIAQYEDVVDKHFLFFYSGHGDSIGGYSLSLPGEELIKTESNPSGLQTIPLYASELKGLLDSIPCRAMTVVLGQCYSGGFVDSIAAPNRVVIAACQPDEQSFSDFYGQYDVFLRNWTDAINESDSIGMINSDMDNNGRVTMKESYDYALSKETINDYGNGLVFEEHPMYSSAHAALGEDLSINYLPETLDLFIRDNEDDTGKEYNVTTEPTWNSPDIWLRNQDDGLENHSHENIVTDSLSTYPAYIYTKVSNRGLGDYNGSSKKLTLYWVNTAIGTNFNAWFGTHQFEPRIPPCGLIASVAIDSLIMSDSCVVMPTQWSVPSYLLRSPLQCINTTNIGLLAVVDDSIKTELNKGLVYNLLKDKEKLNDVALKNMTIINTTVDTLHNNEPINPPIIFPVFRGPELFSLSLEADNQTFSDLNLSIELSDDMYENWLNSGSMVQEVLEDEDNPKLFHLIGSQNRISGLNLNCEKDSIKLYCNPIAKERQCESAAIFHLVVRDSLGKEQDAMAFQTHLQSRLAMTPMIVKENGRYQAANIAEPAIFEWFDDANAKIGVGKVLQPGHLETSELRLKVTAISDGAVARTNLSMMNESIIRHISPIPFNDYVQIVLNEPATKNYQIKLWSGDGTLLRSCALMSGALDASIDTRALPQGRYVLTLLVDGKMVETRNVVKSF